MFKKKIPLWVVLILCAICVAAGVFGYNYFYPQTRLTKNIAALEKIVQENFDGEFSADDVNNAALLAYIKTLDDKYASYIPSEYVHDYNAAYKGEETGVGLNVLQYGSGNMLVTAVHSNSPADKAGLSVFDYILSVDGTKITAENYSDILNIIDTKKIGEKVKMTVNRGGKTLDFDITISDYVKQTVFYEKTGDIGFIKITHFEEYTVKQFKEALKDLQDGGVKGLIFDVRSNSGGLVNSVSQILDILVPQCDIITAKDKNGESVVMYKSDENEVNLPMAVLTDGESASASELFTATLREMKDAKVYGEKTFGKGIMQSTFTLPDGSIVKITTAKYYSAKGNNWNGEGIKPDVEVSLEKGKGYMAYIICIDDDPVIKAALQGFNK